MDTDTETADDHPDGDIDIIYIAGSGRSGTTLLDRILGTSSEVISFNEVYRLLIEGVDENNLCACGEQFRSCGFWDRICRKVFSSEAEIERIRYLHDRLDHSRHFFRLFFFPIGRQYRRDLNEYCAWLARLYRALAEESGLQVLVDSSKVPSRALLLTLVPGFRVHVIHLVRDVRAVANAWNSTKLNPAAGSELPVYSYFRSVAFWHIRQIMSWLLGRRAHYVWLRYEDLIESPRESLSRIQAKLPALSNSQFQFNSDGSVLLEQLHSIGGNPDRFKQGSTKLILDEKWRQKMSPANQNLIGFSSFILLKYFGYSVRP